MIAGERLARPQNKEIAEEYLVIKNGVFDVVVIEHTGSHFNKAPQI